MSTYSSPLFISLERPHGAHRWGSFATSYVVQTVALMALLVYSVVGPRIDAAPLRHIDLVAPDLYDAPPKVAQAKPVHQVVKPALIAVQVPARIQPPPLELRQPQRVHHAVQAEDVAQPQLAVNAPMFDSKILNALPGPKANRIVATNTFGGSSAAPTLQNIAPGKVQTGGFGDPNGVPLNAHGSNRSNIAAAGSFDLPPGGGYGNGTGGSKGARGTVASAGFGNGVAVQGGGGRGGSEGQGRIQSTGFVNAAAAPVPDEHHLKAVGHALSSVPVMIQSKPTPVYTSEARQLRVEGEVLLSVVFTADGQIRILNVVRGLGHGLDEAAQRAAQGVKFSPAMRDGHPVDANATLHIVFQLS
jgi:TonB family protein